MKIGIVGSSKIQLEDALPVVEKIIMMYNPTTTEFVSGGAAGVDRAVMIVCDLFNIKFTPYPPDVESWNDVGDKIGYKTRNLKIAAVSDHVVSIALSGGYCYHCHSDTHQKTAGCFTARRCKSFEIFVIDQNTKELRRVMNNG